MHVHELNPKKTVITMAIFVIVILAGLFTITNPRLKYVLTPEQTVLLAVSDKGGVTPDKLDDILTGSTVNAEIIDIRNHYEFARGHISGAKNISAVELLEDDHIKWLKELQKNGIMVIIYGQDQMQANGPWMVFRQLGFDNVHVLLGGYHHYLATKNQNAKTYSPGKAEFNYAEVAKVSSTGGENNNKQPKKTTIIRRKKKGTVAAGGC
jgi:3-mercaptopyruvate sulfurtransferase SseA